ncbi:hypothetical protein [Synechococcus sp. M16CYN]|uniref:hypothetical protein n=1 Tax=Synechococcus sp. M16CYN TaxID=3103139 RepID=UPI00333F19BA
MAFSLSSAVRKTDQLLNHFDDVHVVYRHPHAGLYVLLDLNEKSISRRLVIPIQGGIGTMSPTTCLQSPY